MSKIMGIEISDDEEMEAEALGLTDYIETEADDIMESTDDLEAKAEQLEKI